MRQEISALQKVKMAIHTAQALMIFILACITIAVFTMGKTGGGSKWMFAVCWLSVPALIYLAAVPLWTRAENLAKAIWFAAVDTLFAIFWLSAVIAVAVYKRAGVNQGASDLKLDASKGNCTIYAASYGLPKQCNLSHASSIMGLFVFLLFLATAGISIFYFFKARKDPQAHDPWLKKTSSGPQAYTAAIGDTEYGNKDGGVWDHNTQELDDISDHSDDEHGHTPGLPGYSTHEDHDNDVHNQTAPGRPAHWDPLGGSGGAPPLVMPGVDTEYRGAAASPNTPDSYGAAPEYNPSARYGGGSAGYSFSRPEVGR
ncbi:hypothetical protein Vi05172_g12942 [Venturia inaequalis]|uniref:MARVEL domain-containing protein n=1 Tax=Venturia inaequalis TaxID=5025 RepID=A0A8H3VRK2_VENIN|nr:hypothetical protein EG327_011347 [Venturia inaequalis]RDI77080.1 hypothetical protein Vi05172_g12942 [Venturia inaequalis]